MKNHQTKKQKSQKNDTIKTIIIGAIAFIIFLLLAFSEDIVNLYYKNKIAMLTNSNIEIIEGNPNTPKLSAGMIPVKCVNNYWQIAENNTDWYSYENGEPAYMMLNDGTYQSELVQNMDRNNQKLASENIGAQIQQNQVGSIYMWIPRFEVNDTTGDIKYIQDTQDAEIGYTIPDIFAYKQTETKPDFLLTGVWIAIDTDANYATTINNMTGEDNTYGFIANTKFMQITENDINAIEKFVGVNTSDNTANAVGVGVPDDPQQNDTNNNTANTVGNDALVVPLSDITNTNRIILKIINTNNIYPIKATGVYNPITEKVEVKVTYTQYGISKILYDNENELALTKEDRIIYADTGDKFIQTGEHKITIIDNKNNVKELYVYREKIYANLYSDGTLVFSTSEFPELDKELVSSYGDITDSAYSFNKVPWYSEVESITNVNFVNKIYPISTSYWFQDCKNLITINNIANLKTNNVTNMAGMFWQCSNLTSLDVSNFNTAKVTNMYSMFYNCSSLTSINASNFNTSNVTNMWNMFGLCSNLTSLDVSGFDTSNVTDMGMMFYGCSGLTSLDVSTFDTSNITDMEYMFQGCSNLTELDLSSFDTGNVTDMMYMFDSCNSLTSLNVGNFDTSNVTDMRGIFNGCSNLTELDLSSFDTRNVTNMSYMFSRCTSLTSLDLSSFDTSNVTNMMCMFGFSNSLAKLDLTSFNTRNVTDMTYMFVWCEKLKTINVGSNWTTTNATTTNMFTGCGTSSVTVKQ